MGCGEGQTASTREVETEGEEEEASLATGSEGAASMTKKKGGPKQTPVSETDAVPSAPSEKRRKRARRGRGEGSIYFHETKKLWVTQVTVGHDENGKRKRRTLYGKTKADVRKKLLEVQRLAHEGSLPEPTQLRVGKYLDEWLKAAKDTVRPSTHARYTTMVNNTLKPAIGGVRLTQLQPLHVQQMLTRLREDGASERKLEMAYVNLNRALNLAVKWGYLNRNPCEPIEKPKTPKSVVHALSAEQAKALIKASKDDRLHALIVMAISTGMRQGELLGLEWDDVDLKHGYVMVKKQLEELEGKHKLAELKTDHSRRRIDLDRQCVEALKAHKKKMKGEGYEGGLVFRADEGGYIRKSNLTRRTFKPLLKAAGLDEKVRFHDLRHTAATLLLRQGVHPKIVQERLGHARVAMTLDTYSHVLPSMQADAVSKLDALWEEASPKRSPRKRKTKSARRAR